MLAPCASAAGFDISVQFRESTFVFRRMLFGFRISARHIHKIPHNVRMVPVPSLLSDFIPKDSSTAFLFPKRINFQQFFPQVLSFIIRFSPTKFRYGTLMVRETFQQRKNLSERWIPQTHLCFRALPQLNMTLSHSAKCSAEVDLTIRNHFRFYGTDILLYTNDAPGFRNILHRIPSPTARPPLAGCSYGI